MKKFIFVFIVFVFCLSSNGQNSNRLIHIGFGAGMDFPTNKKSDTVFHIVKSTNFELGAFLRIGNKLYGQIGIYDYINQIQTTKPAPNDGKLSMHQIAIPISGGYAFHLGEKSSIRLFLGVRYRGIVRISNNALSVNDKIFNKNNGDAFGGVGLTISILNLDLSYRKAFNSLGVGSSHYQDAIHLGISLVF